MRHADLARNLVKDPRRLIEIGTTKPNRLMVNLRRFARRHGWGWRFAKTSRGVIIKKSNNDNS